jgi:hypothetical protein
MARIIYGAIGTEIRGSIGGTTFQKNAYGFTIKNKPNMVKPNTMQQNSMKKYMGMITSAWANLATNNKDQFNSYASSFPQYAKHNSAAQLSGFAVFTRWNVQRLISGQEIETEIVQENQPLGNHSLMLSRYSDALDFHVEWQNPSENWNINYYFSRVVGSSQYFIGTRTRFFLMGYDSTDTESIAAQYIATFGALPDLGQQIAIDFVPFGINFPCVRHRRQALVTLISGD